MKKLLLSMVLILLISMVNAEGVHLSELGAVVELPDSFVSSTDDVVVAVSEDVIFYASQPKYEEDLFLFISDKERIMEENEKRGFKLEFCEELEGFETQYLKFHGYKDGVRNVVLYYTVISQHEVYFAFASERRLGDNEIKQFDAIVSDITFNYTLEQKAAGQHRKKQVKNTIMPIFFMLGIVMFMVSAMNRKRPEDDMSNLRKCEPEDGNICPNCRKPYKDGEDVCTACGIKISEWKKHGYCRVCGGVIPEDAEVCSRCGAQQ